MTEEALIHTLDGLAAQAWPAVEAASYDGWQLRASSGVTRRANSVLTLHRGEMPLTEKVAQVEEFYAQRGLPARYQLSPASPPGLDELLQARGYAADGHAFVQVADIEGILSTMSTTGQVACSLAATPSAEWFGVYDLAEGGRASEREGREKILRGIVSPKAYVLLSLGGRPASVGLGVLHGEWLGLFCMATHPEYRRRGLAAAVLGHLAGWAREQGGRRVYLQVMTSNGPAIRLYEKVGFRTLYQYHYRYVKSSCEVASC